MASHYKAIHPVKYLRDYFSQNIRPDGREFNAFRPVSINVSSVTHADGSAVFKIGNTTAVCGIKAELATPKAESPNCGFIVPNVELSPLSSPKFRPGPPGEEAQCITKLVERILTNSGALDLRDLCIYKDKMAWVLYCDIVCVDYDGSIIDAAMGAFMAALKSLTLPEVNFTPETGGTIVHPTKRSSVPVYHLTVCTTFAIFEDELLITDPTEDEESLSLGTVTVARNEEDLCFVHKSGGIPIPNQLLLTILTKSKIHSDLVRKLVETATSSVNHNVNKEHKTPS